MNPTATFLRAERAPILAEALAAVGHTPRYAAAGVDEAARRLETLYDELTRAVTDETLVTIADFGRRVAEARFAAGYDLSAVQGAVNALEEAVWRRLFAVAAPEELGESLRLVSTALGAMKDALAGAYVDLAAGSRERAVDVGALFAGT
jgi:hypothetical protein